MPVLACDLGGTRIKLGIVAEGRVIAREVIPAHSDQGLAMRLPVLAEAFRELCGRMDLPLASCAGLAVAFPSIVDAKTGRILDEYGKYRDALSIDLRSWAKDVLGLPLAIENDARMATIGEWRHGAGRGCDNLVMITLGTGIGTSAIIEGRVLRGCHGQAGQMGGHSTIRYGGKPCVCGNLGCVETEASTAVLSQIAKDLPGFSASPLSREPVLDYAAIFRHAALGDVSAKALIEHTLSVWSALTVNLIHAYDPECVILGGGIMASGQIILPAIQAYVNRHAHTPWGKVRIIPSQLGDEAALAAAEWLLAEQMPA